MNNDIKEAAPADLCIYSDGTAKQYTGMVERLRGIEFPISELEQYVEVTCYTNKHLHMKDLLEAQDIEEIKKAYPFVQLDSLVEVYTLSDYNRIASFYGDKTYELKENETAFVPLDNSDLSNILCISDTRTILNGNMIP